jgi:predicted DNA-binding transcriptional regulator AlpA
VQNPKLDRFIRIPEICERLGVHRATVYRNLGDHLVEVTPGVTGMSESKFVEYQQSRPLRRQKPAKSTQAPIRARKAKLAAGRQS